MTTPVRFYFDFTSPYTYLASTQLDAYERRVGVTFEWTPAFLAGIMKATGNQPPAALRARAMYMADDLLRWATLYGVPFVFAPNFPIASQHATRAALAVAEAAPDKYRPFVDACFRATWVEGKDIGDRTQLGDVGASLGLDRALVANATDDPRWKDALKKNTEQAVSAGAYGLPAFVLGGDELYFGNDRLVLLEARIKRGAPFPRATSAPSMDPIGG